MKKLKKLQLRYLFPICVIIALLIGFWWIKLEGPSWIPYYECIVPICSIGHILTLPGALGFFIAAIFQDSLVEYLNLEDINLKTSLLWFLAVVFNFYIYFLVGYFLEKLITRLHAK